MVIHPCFLFDNQLPHLRRLPKAKSEVVEMSKSNTAEEVCRFYFMASLFLLHMRMCTSHDVYTPYSLVVLTTYK